MHFVVTPGGAWGTAMALHLSRMGHIVTLIFRDPAEAAAVATGRENSYLSGCRLPDHMQIGCELAPALLEADVLVVACPSKFLRSQCQEVKAALSGARSLRAIVSLTKGLESQTQLTCTQVIEQELPGLAVAVLSGPTFASQVGEGQPGAAVLASVCDKALLKELQHAMSGESLRLYTSTDTIGVELAGSLKNVYAIASGICDGLGFRDNAKAALLTRALAEMVRLGTAMGGRVETFYGLSGFGDLVLTCNGAESRNRTFGEEYAKGVSVDTLLRERQMTVEGYRTCAEFYRLCQHKKLEAPILAEIHAMLYEGKQPLDALKSLMMRELKAEL